MTYCLAIRVDDGIVFAADTRTNAGVDYVSSHRKLHVFQPAPDRTFVLLSAGNLATTQEVLDRLDRDLARTDGGESLGTVPTLFEAAGYLGRLGLEVQEKHAEALSKSGVDGATTWILGGELLGEPHGLFLVYPQGNYIRASDDTPFLQIGESKYGKPMLDRLVTAGLGLEPAARLALISLEATVRSNVTVGAPFDFAIKRSGELQVAQQFRIEGDSPYYQALRESWHEGLLKTFEGLPLFEWEAMAGPS